jgi:hypothetical protein
MHIETERSLKALLTLPLLSTPQWCASVKL